jgi:hypothetical protein
MYLISASEVENIAFTTPPATGTIKDGAIATSDNEILSLVGQSIYDGMKSKTTDPVLLESYVKPYMAFSIKLTTLNTKLSDGGLTADETYLYQQAIKSTLFNKKTYYSLLTSYLSANYGIPRKIISGFIID